MPENLLHAMDLGREKGASHWLAVLPLSEHRFTLHKGAFRDAVSLCYGWNIPYLSTHCVCGIRFTIEHAFSCPTGGFPTLGHNLIRDITADLLTEVCHSISLEPTLRTLTGEQLQHRTANMEDGACADICAQGFWGDRQQLTFFDIRVLTLTCQAAAAPPSLPFLYRQHKNKKRHACQQRILEVEHGSFTPIVFSASGNIGPVAMVMYRRLAGLLVEKCNEPYSRTLGWILCALKFALLQSAIQCIRGACTLSLTQT